MRRIRVGSGGTPHPGNGGGSGGPLNSSLSESEYQRVRGLVKSGGRGEDGLDNQMKLLEYIRENGTSFGDRVLGVECEEELGKILSKGASGFSRTTPITVSREVEKGEPWVNKILNDTSALDTFREAWAKEAESELERWSSHKFALPSLSSLPKLPIQANTLQKPPSLLQQQRQISQTVQTTIQQQQQQQQNQQYQQYQQQPQQQQQRSSNCRRLLNPSAKRGGKFDPASSLLKPYIRYDDEDAKDCDDEYDEEDNGNGFHMKTDFISASTKHALDEAKKGRQQQQQQQPQRSSSSLAKSNKTLGMKRKFVVPIKRDPESGPVQSNNAGNSGNGNNNSSHKAQPPKKKSRGENEEGENELTDINGVPLDDPRLRNSEPELLARVQNEMLDQSPSVGWNDICGLEYPKKCVMEAVMWPMLRPDLFHGLRVPPKGLLLFGPPGTGKTMIGKAIASESKAAFFNISASTLTSKWIGEGEKTVRALFAVARCYPRSVIFIDEIDSVLTQRTDTENEASRRLKTEFLVQLDGASVSDNERMLVVGATNRPQELDEAARRRMTKRLYIPLPEKAARKNMIEHLVSTVSHSLSDEDFDTLAVKTNGYSGSDIKALCQDAAMGPIRKLQSLATDIATVDAALVLPVALDDFDAALSHVRPSVSQADLSQYVEWNSVYGSFSAEDPSRTV